MKKLFILLLISIAITALSAHAAGIAGDVNGDGVVTAADVTALYDMLLSNDGSHIVNGDQNGDGVITAADVTAVYERLLGSIAPSENHEWVDLGLPSGTLWATMNVGASSPEGYGDFFAWGETVPNKRYYYCDNYKWYMIDHEISSLSGLTKYCTSQYQGYHYFKDNKTVLDPEDDAAYVNWGPEWRMPTHIQLDELRTKCTSMWTTQNGVIGKLFTGPNGASLFLPAAGYRIDYSDVVQELGSCGEYWSRNLEIGDSYGAVILTFYRNESEYCDELRIISNRRYYGSSVRAVRVSQN